MPRHSMNKVSSIIVRNIGNYRCNECEKWLNLHYLWIYSNLHKLFEKVDVMVSLVFKSIVEMIEWE